jgi:hypothetical protein
VKKKLELITLNEAFGERLKRFAPREKISCVYFLSRKGEVVYVGQTCDLESRVNSHRQQKRFDEVCFFEPDGDRVEHVEAALIKALRPPLNFSNFRLELSDRDQKLISKYAPLFLSEVANG